MQKFYDKYQINYNLRKKELQLSKLYFDVADFSLKELDSIIGLVDYPKTVLHDVLKLYESDKKRVWMSLISVWVMLLRLIIML